MNRPALFVVLLATASACVMPEDDLLEHTEAELSAFDWSSSWLVAYDNTPAEVATLGTNTYMVSSAGGSNNHNLAWRKRKADGTWTTEKWILGVQSEDAPSLAAFNGYLYMVYAPAFDPTQVWFSRFDPATETWKPSVQLPYVTAGTPPALAAFDNRLFIVGIDMIDNGLFPIWVATMNASETPTHSVGIGRKFSAGQPSLAVFGNKLYMAHRNSTYGEIMYATHNAGAAPHLWSSSAYIRAAPSSLPITGDEFSIAAVNGYLHLVHRRMNTTPVYWTYFDQCTWTPEIAINTTTTSPPTSTPSPGTRRLSLTAGATGLVLARSEHPNGLLTYTQTYAAPPTPERLPRCLGAI